MAKKSPAKSLSEQEEPKQEIPVIEGAEGKIISITDIYVEKIPMQQLLILVNPGEYHLDSKWKLVKVE